MAVSSRKPAHAGRWQETHTKVRDAAAALLRKRGLQAPSIADVMGAIGKTVGGFYAHWDSKEALFDEALGHSTRLRWQRFLEQAEGADAKERTRSLIRTYVSRWHRDSDSEGCPLPTVLDDITQHPEPYRGTLNREVERFAEALVEVLPKEPKHEGEALKRALGLIALMIGGVTLARAAGRGRLSDLVLEGTRSLAYSALGLPLDRTRRPEER